MLRFIDLFAGMGGTRIGLQDACAKIGLQSECVFTSEIKPHAINIYRHNFNNEVVYGDITQISAENIPDFDVLLAGFPCQAFSTAGKQHGFNDTRGTLFFDIARIIKEKKPAGFILENVAGLVSHDRINRNNKIGRTLEVILLTLNELGYKVSWRVLDAENFGVPQKRERIYIVGHLEEYPDLDFFTNKSKKIKDILEEGLPTKNTPFTNRILSLYKPEYLYGKAIKDKRGGIANIHSWDLELKGSVTKEQKKIMGELLKHRRKKHWAERKGIVWMDGMPLTAEEIYSFYNDIPIVELRYMLDDLVKKKYLAYEHPKNLHTDEKGVKNRRYDTTKEKGYNIVAGKLSFEITKILDPDSISNTLVATEVDRIAVVDRGGLRGLSNRECLRLSGFPDTYESNIREDYLYDLIGNTVVVPVISAITSRLLDVITNKKQFRAA
jgi:DNA (cytosine-5)-methyltransferase 1